MPSNCPDASKEATSDEECLKTANSLLMALKADVRILNAYATQLLPPPDDGASGSDSSRDAGEAARRYNHAPNHLLGSLRLLGG